MAKYSKSKTSRRGRGRGSRRGRTYRQRGGGGSARKNAADYMNELNLIGQGRLKFAKRFNDLGSNEEALEIIKRDKSFIENLEKDENKALGVLDDFAENKAIEFMDVYNLSTTKRKEFMDRFRQLGRNEQAIETIMNDPIFFKSLTDHSSRDNRPVSANTPYSSPQYNDISSALQHYSVGENTRPVSANTPSSHDNYTSSVLQHYGLE